MRKLFLSLCLSLMCFICLSQQPGDFWVLAFIETNQPVFTMIQEGGQMSLAEEDPTDSTLVYGPGLMTLEVLDAEKAVTHSWEGEEQFTWEQVAGELRLYGKRDTLYGTFGKKDALVLQSTLDDLPTRYFFVPYKRKNTEQVDFTSDQWTTEAKGHFFDDRKFFLSQDAVDIQLPQFVQPNDEYDLYRIGKVYTIEYYLKAPIGPESGVVYLFPGKKGRLDGVYFPVKDEYAPPSPQKITFSESGN